MMFFGKLIFFCFLGVAFGRHRYVIDSKSCVPQSTKERIQLFMDSAIGRSSSIANLFRPHLDAGNTDAIPDRIKNQAQMLFGNTDLNTFWSLYTKFSAAGAYQFHDVDNWSQDWINARDSSDLEVFCNVDYIEDDSANPEPNINWKDTVQMLPVEDGSALLKLKGKNDGDFPIQAVCSPSRTTMNDGRWPPGSPEVITLAPDYIATLLKKNVLFNTARIAKAEKGSLADRIGRKLGREKPPGADILATGEGTMLHEVMHLRFCGGALDTAGQDSYGWANCVKLKDINNAENLMFFGIAFDLIQNYQYDINEKGELKKIT